MRDRCALNWRPGNSNETSFLVPESDFYGETAAAGSGGLVSTMAYRREPRLSLLFLEMNRRGHHD